MTPLRQKMIDAMILRGFAARTQQSYLYAVTQLVKHYHQSPDKISDDDILAFFLYLAKEKKLASSSCRLHLNALRFLYREVLGRPDFDSEIRTPKKPQRIPELLTRQEALAIVNALANFRKRGHFRKRGQVLKCQLLIANDTRIFFHSHGRCSISTPDPLGWV